MIYLEPSFSVNADVTNPGQFFACCGLLELAQRLWPSAEGWFDRDSPCFRLASSDRGPSLASLISRLRSSRLNRVDAGADDKTCPLCLTDDDPQDKNGNRLLSVRLDWWLDKGSTGASLKTWAGQQKVTTISRAMLHNASNIEEIDESWLKPGKLTRDPDPPNKVVEPFYFDARRFAHSLDVGFSLDAQGAETVAHPAVELLCLIGLQRFRPAAGPDKWSFDYWTWSLPLTAAVAAGVVSSAVPTHARVGYRFHLRFRDDQKRYKAFSSATPIGDPR